MMPKAAYCSVTGFVVGWLLLAVSPLVPQPKETPIPAKAKAIPMAAAAQRHIPLQTRNNMKLGQIGSTRGILMFGKRSSLSIQWFSTLSKGRSALHVPENNATRIRRIICRCRSTGLGAHPVFGETREAAEWVNPLINASSQKLGEGKTFPAPTTPLGCNSGLGIADGIFPGRQRHESLVMVQPTNRDA